MPDSLRNFNELLEPEVRDGLKFRSKERPVPIDLTKLTPLPLELVRGMGAAGEDATEVRELPAKPGEYGEVVAFMHGRREDAKFFLLARNAFDVQERRCWGTARTSDGFWIATHHERNMGEEFHGIIDRLFKTLAECFEAMIKAVRWYAEHVERPA